MAKEEAPVERFVRVTSELDAASFHFYPSVEASGDWCSAAGETAEDLARLRASLPTPRDAVAYIMDAFPIVKRKDIETHSDYRTNLVILDTHDCVLHAIATGQSYQTLLDAPLADLRCCHPAQKESQA